MDKEELFELLQRFKRNGINVSSPEITRLLINDYASCNTNAIWPFADRFRSTLCEPGMFRSLRAKALPLLQAMVKLDSRALRGQLWSSKVPSSRSRIPQPEAEAIRALSSRISDVVHHGGAFNA